MPVHTPGPRLYHSIPFKHLAKKSHAGGGGAAGVHLNITPFVDMMTILVSFLLMVFSATGDILTSPTGMELPGAAQQSELQRAPVIMITQSSITFNNVHVAETQTVFDDPPDQWKVAELFDKMQHEQNLFKMSFDALPDAERRRCTDPDPTDPVKCLDGLAILQSDRRIKAKVINRVIKTANAAGYTNIMFAVERRAGGPSALPGE
jgi:biopolymer transport protein ExbD